MPTHDVLRDHDGGFVALRPTPSDLPAEGADLALQVPYAGLPGVAANQGADRRLGEGHLLACQAVVPYLLRDQMLDGDLQFLFLGVAGQLQHLHAVSERRRDGIHHVCGREEQHFRKIERHVQVVVAEGVVLLGIQDFEERRRGISAEVGAQLVDLVQDEYGILRFGPPKPLDDLTRQRPDVRSTVPPDFRFVTHPAEGYPDELPAERIGNRLCQRCLADSGWAKEAEDGPLHIGIQLAHSKVLDDAVLHLLEPRVIRVEDLLRSEQVKGVFGPLGPWERHEPIEVGPRYGVLRRRDGHLREPIQLARGFLLDSLRHAGGVYLVAQLVDLFGLVVALAELLLNRLELLAEEVLTLVLSDLRLHLRLNLRSELQNFELLDQDAVQRVHPGPDVERLEHFLLD